MPLRLRTLATAMLVFCGLCGAAHAQTVNPITFNSYRMENRPEVMFPAPDGNRVHVSPYPMSKRSASVWASDFCWRECSGQAGWKFQGCARADGPEACRQVLDYDNRTCLRACRSRGGPLIPFD